MKPGPFPIENFVAPVLGFHYYLRDRGTLDVLKTTAMNHPGCCRLRLSKPRKALQPCSGAGGTEYVPRTSPWPYSRRIIVLCVSARLYPQPYHRRAPIHVLADVGDRHRNVGC